MNNTGQQKQQRFNELMIAFQRTELFPYPVPDKLYEWKWAAMQFICIKKSGIKPHEFADMLQKQDGYTLLEMAHIVSAIELRPAKDLELELSEFVECQEQVMALHEQLNAIISPKQKEFEEQAIKEIDDLLKAQQVSEKSFSEKLKSDIAEKNKTIEFVPQIGEA